MIKITQYNQICLDIIANVPGIKEHVLAVHEGDATKKLGTKAGVILLGIIPAADRTGRSGQQIDNNATLFYILEKAKTGADELLQYQTLQDIVIEVREYIEEKAAEGVKLFTRYNPSATIVDPESFSGFNGWSLSLEF
jgi:hypothetical protein